MAATTTPKRASKTKTVKKIKLQVDSRTEDMSIAALECREANHPWTRLPTAPARRAELLQRGQFESIRSCTRCGTRRIDLYDIGTFELYSRKYEHADGYLISDKGTGRLYAADVRKALFARDNPDLVSV